MIRKAEKKTVKKEPANEAKAYQAAFFILPAEALLTLREELAPLANDDAIGAIMFRYGFRSGQACAQSMDIAPKGQKQLSHLLPGLWEEIGLGKLDIKKHTSDGIECELGESMEAQVMGDAGKTSCDFTRGYLAGCASAVSGQRYHCKEEMCVSKGDGKCVFILEARAKKP